MFVIPSRLSCAGRVVTRAGRTTLPRRDKVTKICFFCRWKAPSVLNMFKLGIMTFITMLAMTRSEPPVNSYLPPRTGISVNSGQADLSTHGTPDFGNGGSINRNGGATSFGSNGPSKLYGAPIGENARVNGLGQSRGNGFGDGQSSNSYSASSFGDFNENSGNVVPSSSYGVPIANGNNGGGFRNGGGNGDKPSINYGVPGTNGNNGHNFRNRGNGVKPSTSYGVPGRNGNHGSGFDRNNGNGKPSGSYGVPGANGNTNKKNHLNGGNNGGKFPSSYESSNVPKTNGFGGTNGGLSSNYGPSNKNGHGNNGYPSESPRNGESFGNGNANGYPSGNGINGQAGNFENGGGSFKNGGRGSEGYNDNAQEESTEPAKYEFSYEVKDEQSGSNYGHTETRNGDRAQGEFNVLLPDGRKQIVEYEADQDGFKPQIRYDGEANTGGGYNSGGPNGNNDGYSSGRPNSKSGGFADSGFNGGSGNGYPNGGPSQGKSNGFNGGGGNGYQSGKPGQSFSQDNDNNLSGGGFFSNALSNNIGGNADIDSNRQNGNGGYQY
ncbi:pro-resilin-like isoform X2 [Cataglyphis hispanica]|uniref:pro-resilin-like isoform X2 n=1 Tax=Cataglyphis hispanica TaxID=1086592 RepID=UPI00217FAAC3|nr:pro-resilin-like isoform X2 [Cataglyphis hispanica]